MSTPLKTLIAKLNPTCRKAAERAASLCFARGHYEVDLEHLFVALLDETSGDMPVVLRASGVDPHALRADLERELESLKRGNTRTPVFSVHLSELFEQAWLIASLDAQIGRIRSGHLLLALLSAPDLAQFAQRMSPQFARVRVTDLKHKFDEITAGSNEAEPREADAGAGDETDVAAEAAAGAAGGPSKTPALDTYTTNLTQRAREGKIDPVIGRDAEIRQAIDILMRRRQNNPIMTGEAGVGKTAVVEGLALRIAAGDVPPPLAGVALHVLDMGLLQAGASVKGEFENRLKSVIDEVKRRARTRSSCSSTRPTPSSARAARPGRTMRPTCSSRRWRAASCAPSRPPPGASTRSTSRRMLPWRGASRWSRSRSPASRWRPPCCAAWPG